MEMGSVVGLETSNFYTYVRVRGPNGIRGNNKRGIFEFGKAPLGTLTSGSRRPAVLARAVLKTASPRGGGFEPAQPQTGSSRLLAGGHNDSATGRRVPNESHRRGGDFVEGHPETPRGAVLPLGEVVPRDANEGEPTATAATSLQQDMDTIHEPTRTTWEQPMLRANPSPAHNHELAPNHELRNNHAGLIDPPGNDPPPLNQPAVNPAPPPVPSQPQPTPPVNPPQPSIRRADDFPGPILRGS
ncbi:hypothetical protein B0H13DRAFT_1854933 [Mycena leptocephala]|nr:hypothetical protein B0H13DRAFT_1854933 [Mycena leptocephala]